MSKDEAKLKIRELVQKYDLVVKSRSISKYTEEETKKDFILPLFNSLGWDTENKNEVTAEEHQSSGRVDYGFYLDERLKFYLEAKPLKSDLNREDYADQAVKYSWNKGATWAILTDFESLKVFNAQDIDSSLANKLVFEIPYSKYIERFDRLWLLSKAAFKENLLDKDAEEHGKKLLKVSVSALLYKDLDKCREILTHDLHQWNPEVDNDLLDEGVQKILDRLLFLKVAEDRGIEPPTLLPLIRDWNSEGGKKHIYESMVEKFRELDEVYNSNLFSRHPFEKWQEYSWATEKVVKILEGKKGYYEYDFAAMPADVLGSVYENYLGYRLSQSKKGVSLSKDAKKRKEHGIYYTPSFIVDYIVKNTLKPVLDKCTSISDLKKIKVLDPACGSGSFLIKALNVIYEKYLEFGSGGGVFTKIDILLNNIYGVDLDQQAVEIARLNLLINALDTRMKLPSLSNNIKNGNSLISGNDEELKKYFGENYMDKKPFNWNEEFPEVFKQGGFDVIISNPPYVAITGIDYGLRKILEKMYQTAVGRFDLFMLFIEKSINLLKMNGTYGVIIPNKFLTNDQSRISREFILDKGEVISILFTSEKVFSDANVNNIVLIITKNKQNNNCTIYEYMNGNITQVMKKSNSDFISDPEKRFFISQAGKSKSLLKKIEQTSVKLGEIAEVRDGIVAGRIKDLLFQKKKIDSYSKPLLFGTDINRYQMNFSGNYVNYQKDLMKKFEIERIGGLNVGLRMRYKELYERPKILTRKTADRIIATYDNKNYYYEQTLHSTYITNKSYLPLYVLALLNSNLFKYFYQSIVKQSGTIFPQVRISLLKSLPIKNVEISKQKGISEMVQKILDLNKALFIATTNSEKWKSIKSEIEITDKKIDDNIYKFYELNEKEIEIIERTKD